MILWAGKSAPRGFPLFYEENMFAAPGCRRFFAYENQNSFNRNELPPVCRLGRVPDFYGYVLGRSRLGGKNWLVLCGTRFCVAFYAGDYRHCGGPLDFGPEIIGYLPPAGGGWYGRRGVFRFFAAGKFCGRIWNVFVQRGVLYAYAGAFQFGGVYRFAPGRV